MVVTRGGGMTILPGDGRNGAVITEQKTTTNAGHSFTIPKEYNLMFGGTDVPFAPWGSNNRRPQDIVAEMNMSGIAKAGLHVLTDAHYGSGPMYLRRKPEGENEAIHPVPLDDAGLAGPMEFHERVRLAAAMKEHVMNWHWWGFSAMEMLASNDARQITSMKPMKSAWIRWSLMNPETGRIEWCIYNGNWDRSDYSSVSIIPVADPNWTADELREWLVRTGYRKFVHTTMIPDPDAGYYPDKDWHALFDNGWLKQTNSIPGYKEAIYGNQTVIKYLIKIPRSYWPGKFGEQDWNKLNSDEKEQKKLTVYQRINDLLAGKANAGKSIFTEFEVDDFGKPLPGWEIIAIDDKLKEGAFLPDADKGNSEILASMRVDPTLLGQDSSGSGMGAGSGSDKREAYIILNALLFSDREQTLEAWNMVRRFNKWSADIEIGFRNVVLTTLDKNPTGQEKTTI